MNLRSPVKFVIITPLLMLSCAGCVNYEQETFLNDDLSGRTEIRIFLNPKPVLAPAIEKTDTSPEIKKVMIDVVNEASLKAGIKEESFYNMLNRDRANNVKFTKAERNGVPYSLFTAEFEDIRKLYEGKRRVSVTEDPEGAVTYTEYFFDAGPGKDGNEKSREDPEMYKGCYFEYVLHMPREIVRANTDNIDKNTAIWKLPLEAAVKDRGFHITATMKGENRFVRWMKRLKKQKKEDR